MLTSKQIPTLRDGFFALGDCRCGYLRVRGTSRSFRFKYQIGGTHREISVGLYPDVTLAQARDLIRGLRAQVRQGIDPRQVRIEQAVQKATADKARGITFAVTAKLFFDAHQHEWKSQTHRDAWWNTVRDYAFPMIGDVPVDQIGTDDVLKIVAPIWIAKQQTAVRLLGRIYKTLGYAGVMKYRTGENPARWEGHLKELLAKPRPAGKRVHHPALDYKLVAEFVGTLRMLDMPGRDALEFLILTATRSSETRCAEWSEFDLNEKTWAIPAVRMKAGVEQRIPLSDRALEILNQRRSLPSPFSTDTGRDAMAKVCKAIRSDIVVHGFRATFRTWAGEVSSAPREVCEAALAHRNGDATEASYNRGSLFAKRAVLMDEWSAWLDRVETAQVVSLRA